MTETETERLLESLRPSRPSDVLVQRIGDDLESDAAWMRESGTFKSPSKVRWFTSVGWTAMGAAAAVLAMSLYARFAIQEPSSPAPEVAASEVKLVPVSTIREWVDAEDQGIQWNAEQAPERRVRLTTMERHSWIDPSDGAEIIVEQPRRETVLLPVSFQ